MYYLLIEPMDRPPDALPRVAGRFDTWDERAYETALGDPANDDGWVEVVSRRVRMARFTD